MGDEKANDSTPSKGGDSAKASKNVLELFEKSKIGPVLPEHELTKQTLMPSDGSVNNY